VKSQSVLLPFRGDLIDLAVSLILRVACVWHLQERC
jgi:hypothetical protein